MSFFLLVSVRIYVQSLHHINIQFERFYDIFKTRHQQTNSLDTVGKLRRMFVSFTFCISFVRQFYQLLLFQYVFFPSSNNSISAKKMKLQRIQQAHSKSMTQCICGTLQSIFYCWNEVFAAGTENVLNATDKLKTR